MKKTLRQVSPSQITTFHHPVGGCNRKWYWDKILGFRPPQHKSAALGEEVHKTIEAYLRNNFDDPKLLHPLAKPAEHTLRILRTVTPQQVEAKMERQLRNGLAFSGRIDFLATPAYHTALVVDHKTSSSAQYALSDQQLLNDIQMNAYAYEAWVRHPNGEGVRVAHNFMLTKGSPAARYTEALIPTKQIMDNWTYIQDITDVMIHVAKLDDVAEVPENRAVCSKYGGCPFADKCQALWASKAPTPTAQPTAQPQQQEIIVAKSKASTFEAAGIPAENIRKGVTAGTIIDDTGKYGGTPAPATPSAPAKATGVNPPEAKVVTNTAAVPAQPAQPAAQPAVEHDFDAYGRLLLTLGWSEEELNQLLTDDAMIQAAAGNIRREDAEITLGRGMIGATQYDDVIVSVKKRAPAAPAPRRRGPAPAAPAPEPVATEPAPAPQPAPTPAPTPAPINGTPVQGTEPVRRPRNALPRLQALGYTEADVEKMSNAEMHRLLDGNVAKQVAPVAPALTGVLDRATGSGTDGASDYESQVEEAEQAALDPNDRQDQLVVAEALACLRDATRIARSHLLDGNVDTLADGTPIAEAHWTDLASTLRGYMEVYTSRIDELEALLDKSEAKLVEQITGKEAAGFLLYIDCVPSGTYTHLDAFLQPYALMVAQRGYTDERTGKASGPLPHYGLLPYNNGEKAVMGLLLGDLQKLQSVSALVVDSKSPLAARALEILRPLARLVVQGVR